MRIIWAFTGIGVPFLWGAGLTVLGYPHPEFLLASICFILGGVILLGTTAMWTYRNWPLRGFQVGAAIALAIIAVGAPAAAFVWIGSQKAEAQTPAITNNAPSINTFNQSGGNNTVNIGPKKLPFDPAIADALISKLPTGKPIQLVTIGSSGDQQIGAQYFAYLQAKGLPVSRISTGMYAPPPDHKINC